ncbi:aldose 1-epimerase [Halolactibacillus alkaliphilus]|uniref:Aldose 1-epimerase n=1 Tax=Halolactibacillus alkaliphilus TaxID=442899 RepID=A0A511X3M7_9BACI|nr:aldose epimerase family protein [Halolactibacillus alkaliphilus]GEN57552.1 aldose 1-epimerase [Halolactibacillus alkaliphilus]GGN73369.1 aldose 1-epimerase [Halolactibacillus alkaliphilus]SFO96110.1 aldose 1-epimerase [Halolactibacillus alkaliphilus]
MTITTKTLDVKGHNWQLFTLTNNNGMTVKFLDYGGIITEIVTKDKAGKMENVVLGYRDYEDYLNNKTYFGALIGRVAGRIEGASFVLNEEIYHVPEVENGHSLHGGPGGLHTQVFKVETIEHEKGVEAVLYHTSNDLDQGYPGTVTYKISYLLTHDDTFTISYEAVSTKDTLLTITNHSYFNLSGDLKETILDHDITLDASQFVELDDELIPTGKILPVTGTTFDFTHGRTVRGAVDSVDPQNKVALNGYDHFFIFDHKKDAAVVVKDPKSGRKLTVTTDQPGMVMYTSNALDDTLILKERQSEKYLGVCLETQSSPASVVHDGFPPIFLAKNDVYLSKTSFSFETE